MWARIGVVVALCAVVAGCSSPPVAPRAIVPRTARHSDGETTMVDYVAAAEAACSGYLHGFVAIAEKAGPIESEQDFNDFSRNHHTEV